MTLAAAAAAALEAMASVPPLASPTATSSPFVFALKKGSSA